MGIDPYGSYVNTIDTDRGVGFMIAKIAVSAANFAIDKPYSYFVPEGLQVSPGVRVIVPFGRGNRPCEGVVLSLEEGGHKF